MAALLHSRYLPTPLDVLLALVAEAKSGALLHHMLVTFTRVVAAFTVAMLVGGAVGLALGRRAGLNLIFDPWLLLALNVPALVTIVFCYLWIGLNEAGAIAAVALNKIPQVAITLREGARALDPQLDEVATIYRVKGWRRFTHFIWPQLQPYLATAVRNALALTWKLVLVVEAFGRSSGVGFAINLYFGLFDIARIMAYSLAFMAVVMALEAFVIKPWEVRARAWRGAVS